MFAERMFACDSVPDRTDGHSLWRVRFFDLVVFDTWMLK
jgi:hypothetical protein